MKRRMFLQGSGAALLAGPLLSSSKASAGVFPKRLVFMFSPNGTVLDNWRPRGTETSFTLSPILEPLSPFVEKVLILDRVGHLSGRSSPGDPHRKGIGHFLTATNMIDLPGEEAVGGGISVDQLIANEIGSDTRFRSLEFGVQVRGSGGKARMVFQGPSQPVPPEEDPYNAFTRIFGGVAGSTPTEVDATLMRRRSVLDHVRQDLNRTRDRLGAADRSRLDLHASAIRGIETQLDRTSTLTCDVPTLGDRIDHDDPDNFAVVARLQIDLLVAALACDLTRVATLQFSRASGNPIYPWLGIRGEHHTLSHEGDDNLDARDKLTRINHWYAEQFAYMLGKLDEIPEGSGTMLDNTVILWGNELGQGNTHSAEGVPYVLAGNADGYFRTGRYVELRGSAEIPHNNVLLTLCHAMGVPLSTFGNPDYCTGPIARLAV